MILFPFLQLFSHIVDAASMAGEHRFDNAKYNDCLSKPIDPRYEPVVECNKNDYHFEKKSFSQGSTATMTVAKSNLTNEVFAVKRIPNKLCLRTSIRREECFLYATTSNAIAKYECLYADEETIYLMMQYFKGYDLEYWIKERLTITLEMVKTIAMDIGRVLEFINSQDVLHRDVKPANIVYVPNEGAKLVDFEYATKISKVTENYFTPLYASPEALNAYITNGHGKIECERLVATDRYSFGKTLLTLILNQSWSFKFQLDDDMDDDDMDHVRKWAQGIPQEELASADLGPFQVIIQGLLQDDPQKRLDFPQYFVYLFKINASNDN